MGRSPLASIRWCSIPALLSASLLLSYSIAYHSQDTHWLFARSLPNEKVRRNDGKYVVLPLRFPLTFDSDGELDFSIYTNVSIGTDNQKLSMAVSLDGITWVPERPSSLPTFCSNSTNGLGKMAYSNDNIVNIPPSDVSRDDPFEYRSLLTEPVPNATALGYWTEGPVTIGGVSADMRFGVAQYWNVTPILGLGLTGRDESPNRPAYIQSLKQQGMISGTFCSIYDSGDPTIGGEILLGGVDRSKFTGRLRVWDDSVGEIPSPTARYVSGSYHGEMISVGANLTSYIVPTAPGFCVPDDLMTQIRRDVPTIHPEYIVIPCDFFKPDEDYIELTWGDMVLKIPMTSLVTPFPDEWSTCYAQLSYCGASGYGTSDYGYIFGQLFLKSAYVVINPETNQTAIGVSNRNMTSSTITALGNSATLSNIRGISPEQSGLEGRTNVGAIAGGVVGGVAVIGLIGAFFFRRRKSASKNGAEMTEVPELPGAPRPVSELA
ncbi:hypothetical protein Dda_3866 [Drechslerella dactyloides]|uniref:Peptidase A1 domain-containing protein n=1 Tax=Drechslerella dactyloides TaxID=74499 RepID=A0AAD6IYQ6_DREDA|nr:hypothetical protein Dda_3866 [Drechslerella dactyloides]